MVMACRARGLLTNSKSKHTPIVFEVSSDSTISKARLLRRRYKLALHTITSVNHNLLKLHSLLRADDVAMTKQFLCFVSGCAALLLLLFALVPVRLIVAAATTALFVRESPLVGRRRSVVADNDADRGRLRDSSSCAAPDGAPAVGVASSMLKRMSARHVPAIKPVVVLFETGEQHQYSWAAVAQKLKCANGEPIAAASMSVGCAVAHAGRGRGQVVKIDERDRTSFGGGSLEADVASVAAKNGTPPVAQGRGAVGFSTRVWSECTESVQERLERVAHDIRLWWARVPAHEIQAIGETAQKGKISRDTCSRRSSIDG